MRILHFRRCPQPSRNFKIPRRSPKPIQITTIGAGARITTRLTAPSTVSKFQHFETVASTTRNRCNAPWRAHRDAFHGGASRLEIKIPTWSPSPSPLAAIGFVWRGHRNAFRGGCNRFGIKQFRDGRLNHCNWARRTHRDAIGGAPSRLEISTCRNDRQPTTNNCNAPRRAHGDACRGGARSLEFAIFETAAGAITNDCKWPWRAWRRDWRHPTRFEILKF